MSLTLVQIPMSASSANRLPQSEYWLEPSMPGQFAAQRHGAVSNFASGKRRWINSHYSRQSVIAAKHRKLRGKFLQQSSQKLLEYSAL